MAVTTPEFSRPIRLDTLGEGPRRVTIEANAAECARLADRFELARIDMLSADAVLVREGDNIGVTGALSARLVQACVASGADVPAVIAEPFALRFVPDTGADPEEIELDESALDTITYEGSAVDLGEAVAQTLALALDPFPRAADAEAILRAAGVKSEEEVKAQASPFATLLDLKDRLKR